MSEEYVKSRLIISSCLLLAIVAFVSGRPIMAVVADAPAVEQVETRCGWFINPTPANASLYDRDGEWIIGEQGGYQAEGDWPAFGPKQWVETNVHYGYGCACLRLRVNRETHEVIEIKSSRVRPLAACRRDRSLGRWGVE
jgi:Protein of unknown function (DUF4087)